MRRKTRQIDAISEQEPEIRILKVVLVGEDGADTSFGHYMKGIYVEEGGTLDIHGKEKLPWTRLTASLLPQSGFFNIHLGTIHLRRQHVLCGRGITFISILLECRW